MASPSGVAQLNQNPFGFWGRSRRVWAQLGVVVLGLIPLCAAATLYVANQTSLLSEWVSDSIRDKTGLNVSISDVRFVSTDTMVLTNTRLLLGRDGYACGLTIKELTVEGAMDPSQPLTLDAKGLYVSYHENLPAVWLNAVMRLRDLQGERGAAAAGASHTGGHGALPGISLKVSEGALVHLGEVGIKSQLSFDALTLGVDEKGAPFFDLPKARLTTPSVEGDVSGKLDITQALCELRLSNIMAMGKAREGSELVLSTQPTHDDQGNLTLANIKGVWDEHVSLEGVFTFDGYAPKKLILGGSGLHVKKALARYGDVLGGIHEDLKGGKIVPSATVIFDEQGEVSASFACEIEKINVGRVVTGKLSGTYGEKGDKAMTLRFVPTADIPVNKYLIMKQGLEANINGQWLQQNGRYVFKGFVNKLFLRYDGPHIGLYLTEGSILEPLAFRFYPDQLVVK